MRTRAWKGNQGNNFSGAFQFGKDVNNPLDTNYAYGNAIQGIYDTYQEASAKPGADFRSGSFEEFVQDSCKVSSRLTLELGSALPSGVRGSSVPTPSPASTLACGIPPTHPCSTLPA
jgi:hypothetical protein